YLRALLSFPTRRSSDLYYILHEGLIGYLGEKGLQEYTYKKMDDDKAAKFDVTNGWLGITDKYWATALLPMTDARLTANYSSKLRSEEHTSELQSLAYLV